MMALPVPVPPMLEEAVEYPGAARLVSFYWEPAGDEVMYDDGRIAGTGAWDAYLLYTRHRAVAVSLAPYELGSSETPARHRLVLDRAVRTVSVAAVAEARQILRDQWPVADVGMGREITPQEMERLIAAHLQRMQDMLRRDQAAIMAEVEARMAAHARVLSALAAWLDVYGDGQAAHGRR